MKVVVWAVVSIFLLGSECLAQDKSVKPGINDTFKDPKVQEYVEKFEVESREVFQKRNSIVEACGVKPGTVVADIGAGTGLFTRMFSKAVGPEGRVVAVDIAKNFLECAGHECVTMHN